MNEQNPADDSAVQPAADDKAAREERPDRPTARGSVIGIAALLLALLAAAGTGYLWIQQQAQHQKLQQLDELQTRIDSSSTEMGDTRQELARLREQEDRLNAKITELTDTLASQRRQLDELPMRITRLEGVLEKMPGVNEKARRAWLLSEAEYYLRIANAQLGLARNADVALRALELADEQLRDVGDPGLTQVRRALADEMTALRALPHPDTEGIALRLASLGRRLDNLPLASLSPASYGTGTGNDSQASGLARAWKAIKEAFLSLIRVKRSDEAITPLLTEAEESLLLRSMETELELARLALVRGESLLYQDALKGVVLNLQRHFDLEAESVQSTLKQLRELSQVELPGSMPDISRSLQLLLNLTQGDGDSR
ncbi:MAG TPA: hypothetical protein ENK16_05125 [Chromatiales bacterium]|nr:hypothetical protein [Chromatiales bacterium]